MNFWTFRDKMWKSWPVIAATIDIVSVIGATVLILPWILEFIGKYFDWVGTFF